MRNATKNSWVCVDASLIVKALTPNEHQKQIISLLRNWDQNQKRFIAPTHIIYEVVSSFRRMVYLKHITPAQGQQALDDFFALDIKTTSNQQIARLAWNLATKFNRPRAYDAFYLAVAQARQCELWTADKRIYNSVSHELPWVKCVG